MRLAVFSDIHGNLTAFEAVLADLAAQGGADTIWVLGDLVAFGPNPLGCIQAVRSLPEGTKVLRGNTDRELIRGQRCPLPKPTAENWQEFPDRVRVRDQSYQWALEKLTWAEIEYLLNLETETALEIPAYGWVIAFHAVPGNDETIILPTAPDSHYLDVLLDREGRLALGGHTHQAMDRELGKWRWVNPGSVGMPLDGDQRAAYAVISFEAGQAQVDLRRVPYDLERVLAEMDAHQPVFDWVKPRLLNARAT